MNDKKHTWTIDHESKLTDPVVNEGSITGVSYSEENYKKARDSVPFTVTDGEKYLSLFRKGADWAREYTQKEYEVRIDELKSTMKKLKWQLSQFKTYGTDACYNDEKCSGRVTIYRANAFCIECKPEDYKSYEDRPKTLRGVQTGSGGKA